MLDTNICIPFLNGTDESVRTRVAELGTSNLRLCSVVQAELLYGARKSAKVAENLSRLSHLFSLIDSVDFDRTAAEHYGATRVQLEKEGTPIGNNDLLIASITLAPSASER